MKNDLKRWNMFFLKMTIVSAVALIMSIFATVPVTSVNVFAAVDSVTTEEGEITETYINPAYADIISEEDLNQTQNAQNDGIMTAEVDEYYDDMDEAAAYVRACMKNREETIEIGYQAEGVSTSDVDEIVSIAKEIMTEGVAHTGVADEGDYLRWQYGGYHLTITRFADEAETICYMNITCTMTYYTTAEQEEVVTETVDKVLESMNLDSAGDYEIIKAIYDYICTNVTYDNTDHDDDMLQYTAYGALVDGTAVCQGYAVLYYRMLLECDIDVRFISGTGKSEAHGWNIVKLGDYYYNADTTWDASYYASNGIYNYFLRCEDNFTNHTRDEEYDTDEFNAAYPMSDEDYPVHYYGSPTFSWVEDYSTCTASFTCTEGDDTQTVDCTVSTTTMEVTCTTDGQIIYTASCSFEGKRYSDEQIIITEEATGHSYGSPTFNWSNDYSSCVATFTCVEEDDTQTVDCGVDGKTIIEVTCTTEGQIIYTATCTFENESYEDDQTVGIPATGHTWNSGEVTTPATTTTPGVKTYTCTECGVTKTEAIPATGAPAAGTTLTYNKIQYQVTKSATSGGTVSLKKAASTVTSVTVPATITVDGITYKVTAIANKAFSGCKKLKTVTIGKNVTAIGNSAFSGCVKLQSVTIGKNVISIGNNAFANCTKLSKITIPAKVTTIGKKAFYNCKKLKTITIKSKKLKSVGNKAITGIYKKAVIKVPTSKKKAYKKLFSTKTGWKKTMKVK
ncbi:MAG: leucine-rich repeat protein [Clostridiales bacterium]|nr:leucine-rich repeat protein [Clostridiales bacterium]